MVNHCSIARSDVRERLHGPIPKTSFEEAYQVNYRIMTAATR